MENESNSIANTPNPPSGTGETAAAESSRPTPPTRPGLPSETLIRLSYFTAAVALALGLTLPVAKYYAAGNDPEGPNDVLLTNRFSSFLNLIDWGKLTEGWELYPTLVVAAAIALIGATLGYAGQRVRSMAELRASSSGSSR